MTELNLAYEPINEYDSTIPPPSSSSIRQQSPIQEQQQEQIREKIQEQQVQMQTQTQIQKHGLQNYYGGGGGGNYQNRNPEYSFWDRMIMSKREVLKLFILSIVVILGISLEKLGSHYITTYLSSTDLSSFQEFMVRLSFPIIVFLILWIIKSL